MGKASRSASPAGTLLPMARGRGNLLGALRAGKSKSRLGITAHHKGHGKQGWHINHCIKAGGFCKWPTPASGPSPPVRVHVSSPNLYPFLMLRTRGCHHQLFMGWTLRTSLTGSLQEEPMSQRSKHSLRPFTSHPTRSSQAQDKETQPFHTHTLPSSIPTLGSHCLLPSCTGTSADQPSYHTVLNPIILLASMVGPYGHGTPSLWSPLTVARAGEKVPSLGPVLPGERL